MIFKSWMYPQIHLWEGFLTGFITPLSGNGGLALVMLFLGYEFREYQIVHDKDYDTIFYFASGYFFGLLLGIYLFKIRKWKERINRGVEAFKMRFSIKSH